MVSKSYEYKLKSVIKRKISTLLEKELPLLSQLFPNLDLTKNGKQISPLKATIPGSNPGRSISNSKVFNKLNDNYDNLFNKDQINVNNANQFSPGIDLVICNEVYEATLPNSVRSHPVDSHLEIWNNFKNYLVKNNHSQNSIRDKISYAKRYYQVLETTNAAELAILSPDKKSHAMKALASSQISWEV